MHEWRKRVKDLWYHVTLLEDAWKPVMSALADEAHELSDRLGDEHDVSVLRRVGAPPRQRPQRRRPGAARLRRDRRRPAARAAGGGVRATAARLYADKPSVFVGRSRAGGRPPDRQRAAAPARVGVDPGRDRRR